MLSHNMLYKSIILACRIKAHLMEKWGVQKTKNPSPTIHYCKQGNKHSTENSQCVLLDTMHSQAHWPCMVTSFVYTFIISNYATIEMLWTEKK